MKIDTSNFKKGLSKRLTIGRSISPISFRLTSFSLMTRMAVLQPILKKMAGKLEDVWKLETLTNTMILLQDTSRLLLMTMVIPLRKPKRTLRAKGRGFRV